MPASALATIAGLAQAAGVDVETIHAYQQAGLLQPPRRIPGHRERLGFHKDHVERVQFIHRAQQFGFSLSAIGELLGVKGGMVTCADAMAVTKRHLAAIRAEIADPATARDAGRMSLLRRLEQATSTLVESCEGARPGRPCKVLRTLAGAA
jgi:MerR family mercuric resistance operon transcriptional regulator